MVIKTRFVTVGYDPYQFILPAGLFIYLFYFLRTFKTTIDKKFTKKLNSNTINFKNYLLIKPVENFKLHLQIIL